LFVGGWTTDSIYAENEGSQSNATADALIAKVGPDGALYWGVQTGSSDHDEVNDIAVSAHGTVALGGTTSGGIEGQPVGGEDAFVMLLSAEDGSLVWTKQFGSGSSGERVMSV